MRTEQISLSTGNEIDISDMKIFVSGVTVLYILLTEEISGKTLDD